MTTEILAPRDPACPAGCRRHAARRPLTAAAGWLTAAVAALSVAAVPYDAGESVCGVWGCLPPLPAVAAMHLFWAVAFAAGVAGLRAWRPALLRPAGPVLAAVALLAAAHFVGRDALNWLHYAGDEYPHLWPRRVLYRLATLTDIPLVQTLAAGVACAALGRPRQSPDPRDADPCPRPQRSTMKTARTADITLLGLALAAGAFAALTHGTRPDAAAAGPAPALTAADKPVPAPEFAGVTDWVNTEPLKMSEQKGKVVVVHFWTNGCVNCVHNYPHYRAWQNRYKGKKDLVLVGVHTPEFDTEKDVGRIKDRMAKNKLTFAVAVDNDMKTWEAWGNRYWPCVYLVDKAGDIRHRFEGELGDDGVKKATKLIDGLLAEPAPRPR